MKKVKAYQGSVRVEKNEGELPVVDFSTFDINDYLDIYDKINLPTHLKCEFHNNYGKFGGSPRLYISESDFSLKDYVNQVIVNKKKELDTLNIEKYDRKKYLKSFINQIRKYPLRFYANEGAKHAKNHFLPEDSKEGFLQYLFFHEMGEEFALFRHSNKGKKDVICSEEDVIKYVNFYEKTDLFTCEMENLKALTTYNLEPRIELTENECIIQWYEIWTHKGVFLRTYSIKKNPPYYVSRVSEEKVVDIRLNLIY